MTNKIPEYNSSISRWDAAELVEKRIENALVDVAMPSTVRDNVRYQVRVIHMLGKGDITRVYIGRWGAKTFISSKLNQPIDLAVVIPKLVESAKESRRRYIVQSRRWERESESDDLADALNTKYGLKYSSGYRFKGGSDVNSLGIEISRTFNKTQAETLHAVLKGLDFLSK